MRILEQQAAAQERAVVAAREAERLELNQYKAGTVAYTSVVTTQQTALSNEQTALSIRQNRFTSTVALIRALGGGWSDKELPDQIGGVIRHCLDYGWHPYPGANGAVHHGIGRL